jgi:hypothetical protein
MKIDLSERNVEISDRRILPQQDSFAYYSLQSCDQELAAISNVILSLGNVDGFSNNEKEISNCAVFSTTSFLVEVRIELHFR